MKLTVSDLICDKLNIYRVEDFAYDTYGKLDKITVHCIDGLNAGKIRQVAKTTVTAMFSAGQLSILDR